jgi:ATP-dependent Lon protease
MTMTHNKNLNDFADRLALRHRMDRGLFSAVIAPRFALQRHVADEAPDEEFEDTVDHDDISAVPTEEPALVETAVPAAPRKPVRPFKRCIQVFSSASLARAAEVSKGVARDAQKRMDENIKTAKMHDGYRQLPTFRGMDKKLMALSATYQNFLPVLRHYADEMLLAGASRADAFRITPVLLDGPPGVGKTAFAQAIAQLLDLPFRKVSAGGMQHAALLVGTASHWSNAQAGEVFNLIARGESASGILLIDEADKLSDRQDNAILPAMLDLLEPESARYYTDESMGLVFDASRLIVIMTSNEKDRLDPALLSRCKVFDIQAPQAAQKVLIANQVHHSLNQGLSGRRCIHLDQDAVDRLAHADIDTRALIQAVRHGFMQAFKTGAKLSSPPVPEMSKKRSPRIGFIRDEPNT